MSLVARLWRLTINLKKRRLFATLLLLFLHFDFELDDFVLILCRLSCLFVPFGTVFFKHLVLVCLFVVTLGPTVDQVRRTFCLSRHGRTWTWWVEDRKAR